VGSIHESVIAEWRTGLQQPIERAVAEIEQIVQRTMPAFRAEVAAKARAKAQSILQPQEKRITDLKSRIADVERQALPPRAKRTAEDLLARVDELEIQRRLAGKDSLEVHVMYLEAIERDDAPFVRAVEEPPAAAFALLTSEQLAQGRELKLARSPHADELARLRDDLSLYEGLLAAARRDIETAGGALAVPATANVARRV
jgi:hypothetical protein